MNLDLGGLIPATVLPMTVDAQIDEAGLRRYIRHVAAARPKALAINVDTGEGPHLWADERRRVLEIVLDEVGDRVPVIAGLGAQYTSQAAGLARDFQRAGASGLLVFPISAYQGAPLDPEVAVRYHAAIGDAAGLPLVLFVLQPALGGVNFLPDLLAKLCMVTEVAAIKEASFDPQLFVRTRDAVKAVRPECVVLTGNDNFIYESFLLGAEGALIGFGAVATRQQVELIEHALAGRHRAGEGDRPQAHPAGERDLFRAGAQLPCAYQGRAGDAGPSRPRDRTRAAATHLRRRAQAHPRCYGVRR